MDISNWSKWALQHWPTALSSFVFTENVIRLPEVMLHGFDQCVVTMSWHCLDAVTAVSRHKLDRPRSNITFSQPALQAQVTSHLKSPHWTQTQLTHKDQSITYHLSPNPLPRPHPCCWTLWHFFQKPVVDPVGHAPPPLPLAAWQLKF